MDFPAPDPACHWHVIEDRFAVATNRHYEALFALGTGYLSTRSSLAEGLADDPQNTEYDWFPGNTTLLSAPESKSKWGCYLPVLAARHPFRRMGLVNLPCYLPLVPEVAGERLDLENSRVEEHRRWLDLHTATLYRSLVWHPHAGGAIAIRSRRFMDPAQRFVCVQHWELENLGTGELSVALTAAVDDDVRTNGYDKFAAHAVGRTADGLVHADVTTNVGNRVVTATGLFGDTLGDPRIVAGERRIGVTRELVLAPGASAEAVKISAVIADAYFARNGLLEEAAAAIERNAARPPAELHRAHAAAWKERWQRCDVILEADDPPGYDSQLAIRQAVYHLLRAKGPGEDRNLVDPKGMIGDIYYGAAFWDMELFINPFYIYTDPDTGRDTPAYRARHLDRARALARSYGYRGARYPWMQAPDGEPVTAMWQYADHQIHVTADVIIGMWHYVRATGDTTFLFAHGVEMTVETARYWAGRVDVVPGREGYHLYGVMGPDEYKPLTNDNAYTNYCAAFNLRLAGEVCRLMAEREPDRYAELRERIALDEAELERFAEIAAGLPVPRDPERHLVWQCDGWETAFGEVDIDAIWEDRTRLFGSYLSQEQLFRYKVLKQCDVVALMAVFPEAFSPEERAASFDYYKPFNIHDSSNSMCHHMLAATGLGRAEEAWEAWLRSVDIDFGPLPRSANGVHCANVGGMWQEVVFGFAGLTPALNDERIRFRPCLPAAIRRLAWRITWRGQPFEVELTPSELRLTNRSDRELVFAVYDREHHAAPGASVPVPLGP